MSDNRGIVYVEDGIPIYRASSIGLPSRCLTLARAGNTPLEPPEYLVKAAAAGTAIESVVKDRLSDMGWTVLDEQDTIEVPVLEAGEEIAIIRGHLDAMTILSPNDHVERMLEVKSMSANVFDKWTRHRFDRFPTYAAQLSTYMHGAGKPALYAVICRDTDEMELIEFDTPPMDFEDEIASKVRAVEAMNRLNLVPPCTGAEYQCAYSYACDRSEISHEDLKIVGDDQQLQIALNEYNEARDLEARAIAMKTEARDQLITALSGRKKVDVGLTRIQYITSKKKTLNVRKLRDRLGDELDDMYDEKEYTQLRVSQTKEKT